MMLQAPPPPPIAPKQMNLLRVVAAMAWADGHLADEEIEVMLDRFSQLFGSNSDRQLNLKQELREYLVQNLPLEEVVPQLTSDRDKELVLELAYETIAASARTPDEAAINADESAAYTKLVSLLGLAPDVVDRIESRIQQTGQPKGDLIEFLAQKLSEAAALS
ncbi:MAG: TerB family tellurite resistance protein [Oscillatoriales cyanobacterium]|nr:MAG: TerB family tellurite resistance protein [Oscillatoriales cyanobacterium]